jgi:hypothetical protein
MVQVGTLATDATLFVYQASVYVIFRIVYVFQKAELQRHIVFQDKCYQELLERRYKAHRGVGKAKNLVRKGFHPFRPKLHFEGFLDVRLATS